MIFWHNVHSSLQFVLLIVWNLYAFRQRSNFGNPHQICHHKVRLKWKFWILMGSSEWWNHHERWMMVRPIRKNPISNLKNYFLMYKNLFLGEKWNFFFFFFKLLPKFSNSINYDDFIGKITSKSIRHYPAFIQKKIWI